MPTGLSPLSGGVSSGCFTASASGLEKRRCGMRKNVVVDARRSDMTKTARKKVSCIAQSLTIVIDAAQQNLHQVSTASCGDASMRV